MLNSENIGYHLNMYCSVKLIADGINSKILIGDNTRIAGSCIHSKQDISIGNNCLIAANCQIIDSNGHDLSMQNTSNRINTKGTTSPIIIEDSVWIATNCVILPGVTIGEGSVIGSNSVVKNSIPKYSLAAGNPAVVIKQYR